MDTERLASRFELPLRAGVGLRPDHYEVVLRERPDVSWFEVHAENYMGAGGPVLAWLEQVRADYPLSIHGVGLSIGSDDSLDPVHLRRLRTLLDRYQPDSFSEHLAWSSQGGVYLNDLLPLPYTRETLARVSEHIDQVQTHLGQRMLLENPSTYLSFASSTMTEIEFLSALVERTGCGLLLDVNNVYVSGTNQDYSPLDYIRDFPLTHVGEIHLAGYACDTDQEGHALLIDAHDCVVAVEVWSLYAETIARTGPAPTLIEWDSKLPDWEVLVGQARTADRYMEGYSQGVSENVGVG
ncbi:MAG: DUF692 domain-containing protein [Thiogranum sp.]|nr:DUF692 domain-containing protein [Thiogranum sp.]